MKGQKVRVFKIQQKYQKGATMIEYAIMAVLIGAVSVAIVGVIGREVRSMFSTVNW